MLNKGNTDISSIPFNFQNVSYYKGGVRFLIQRNMKFKTEKYILVQANTKVNQ